MCIGPHIYIANGLEIYLETVLKLSIFFLLKTPSLCPKVVVTLLSNYPHTKTNTSINRKIWAPVTLAYGIWAKHISDLLLVVPDIHPNSFPLLHKINYTFLLHAHTLRGRHLGHLMGSLVFCSSNCSEVIVLLSSFVWCNCWITWYGWRATLSLESHFRWNKGLFKSWLMLYM